MFTYIKQTFSIFTFLLIQFMFWSCKPSPIPVYTGNTSLRIINTTPENNNIDFFISDTIKNNQTIGYRQVLNNIVTNAGEKRIYIRNNGTLIERSRINVLFKGGSNYSVFLIGKISKDSLTYINLVDSLTSPSTGKAKVRIVNTISNIGAVETVFTTRLIDSVANFTNINYGSSTDYKEFSPGNYLLKLRKSNTKETLAGLSNIQISAGKVYTIYGAGLVNGAPNYPLSVNLLIDK